MLMQLPPSGFVHCVRKLVQCGHPSHPRILEFARKNAANFLSMANLVMGLTSILCNMNEYHQWACWLLLTGFMLDLADGAVARHLNACSALEILGPSVNNPEIKNPAVPTSPAAWQWWQSGHLTTSRLSNAACPRRTGAKLDDFADFTSFGIATALLLQVHGFLDGILVIGYVLAVFTRLCFYTSGIPFMYRGLPCPYASAILACASLLTGRGHLVFRRAIAIIMIFFMVDQGFYPHDKILESQMWKKLVFVGGILMMLCSFTPFACLYHLTWSISYILFPDTLWSFKV